MRHLPSYVIFLALIPAAALLYPSAEALPPVETEPAGGEMIFRPSCLHNMTEGDAFEVEARRPRAVGAQMEALPAPAPVYSPAPKRHAPAAEGGGAGGTATARPASAQGSPMAAADSAGVARATREPTSIGVPVTGPPTRVGPLPQRRPHLTVGTGLDWGGTTYLSNDDSMSLASAQRVLYAAMTGVDLSVSEIRPHELLNYFSFDTAAPRRGELFNVQSSARIDGDTLQVAFAVQGASPPRQPLDLTTIVDVSGSMAAEGRMEYTRRGLQQMAENLRDGDRLDVVLFNNRTCRVLENYVVGRDDPKVLRQTFEGMHPSGGTNIDQALRTGYELARARTPAESHGRNRRMMLLTDAQMNLGRLDPNVVTEVAHAFEQDGIRLTGIGVGRGFRDDVLDMLTEKGKGAYVYLGSEAVVDRIFGAGFDSLVQTIAHDVQFKLELPPSLALERFYGEESSTVAADVQPIHYYAGTSQIFLQDLKMRDGRPAPRDPVKLTMSWRDAVTGEPASRTFTSTVGQLLDTDTHNVHKAHALMSWSDLLLADAMGGQPCGAPLAAYQSAASRVQGDAEIGFVSGLVQKRCPGFVPELDLEVPQLATVDYKVRVDSDIPIAEVGLMCGGSSSQARLAAGSKVARFDAMPGDCTLTLQGNVAMRIAVSVPHTGGDARCVVRGGRVSCG